MIKLIIDTNSLLVSTPKKSKYRWLFDAMLDGKFQLVVSTEILLEYEEKLAEFYSEEYADMIIQVIVNIPNLIRINPISYNWKLISADPDDNKFIDAYVAGGANYIITDDRHFDVQHQIEFPKVQTVKIRFARPEMILE
jgi:putative PIN family toxin of toxin-antitoxin system